MHNVGTVPTYKMYNIGTVPTFKMHNVGTQVFATLSPTWEFQLGNLASWTLKWHDYATGTTHPPTALVGNQTFMSYRKLKFGVSSSCVVGVKNVSGRCWAGVCKV